MHFHFQSERDSLCAYVLLLVYTLSPCAQTLWKASDFVLDVFPYTLEILNIKIF